MRCRVFLTVTLAAALAAPASWAQEDSDPIPVKSVSLSLADAPVAEALKRLGEQSGIAVLDRRSAAGPNVTLDLKQATFWQVVDAIARQAGAHVSPFQADGAVALTEGRPAEAVSHSGVFRTTARRVELTRDLETGAHTCRVGLSVTWEPWFEPFYVEAGQVVGTFAPDARGKESRFDELRGLGQEPVQGRRGLDVELRLPAPDRSSPRLASLEGKFTVIGPVKMLTVTFDRLADVFDQGKPLTWTEDGVAVTLEDVSEFDTGHWVARLRLEQPPGGPEFESFQSWLTNNAVYLQSVKDPAVRVQAGPAGERVLERTSDRAVVEYHFTEGKGTPKLGRPGQWRLVCRVPGRIVQVRVPFRFRDLDLP